MVGTWRNRLSDEQVDALDTLRLKTSGAAVFRNSTMILMSDAGRSKSSIAEALGCGPLPSSAFVGCTEPWVFRG